MATATDECEYLDKKQWWLNELESLGVGVKETNEFNDLKEVRSLAEIMKQGFYQDYETDD